MIKKILISQPKPSSEKSPYFDIEKEFGVELVFRPFIKVEGITAKEFRHQKVSILDYSAVVFTSRHAIDHFFTLAKELRITIPETMKYFCVTETIALYIQKYVQYRKRKVFFGTTGKIQDLHCVRTSLNFHRVISVSLLSVRLQPRPLKIADCGSTCRLRHRCFLR